MSKTKYCRECGDPLNRSNRIPNTVKFAKNEGRICYDCYKKAKVDRRKNQSVFKNVYIERGRYPKSKVAQKLSKSDCNKWNLVRTLSTLPRLRVDPETQKTVSYDSEFDEWDKGRRFLTSHLGSRHAREGFPAKTGMRAGSNTYVFDGATKIDKKYMHTRCIECGHEVVRYDHRGYKYCTKCFVLQEPLVELEPGIEREPGHNQEPDSVDAIVQRWYRTKDPESIGQY